MMLVSVVPVSLAIDDLAEQTDAIVGTPAEAPEAQGEADEESGRSQSGTSTDSGPGWESSKSGTSIDAARGGLGTMEERGEDEGDEDEDEDEGGQGGEEKQSVVRAFFGKGLRGFGKGSAEEEEQGEEQSEQALPWRPWRRT